MSTQAFYDLMQHASEEAKLMTLDEHFDNWIPEVGGSSNSSGAYASLRY
jgi:hypothetical protein